MRILIRIVTLMAFKHFFSLLNVIIDVIASFFHCVILHYYTVPFLMLGNIRSKTTVNGYGWTSTLDLG